jgi:flagellar biosynthesis chaperone FliJ
MTAFRFRLQRVLTIYEKRARIEEDRLRVIFSDISRVDSDQAQIRSTREDTERNIAESVAISAADIAALAGFIEGTRRDLAALDQKRIQCHGFLKDQQSKVNALRTKIRLLEKLKDRRLFEHDVEVQKELEELAADAFRSASFREAQSVS